MGGGGFGGVSGLEKKRQYKAGGEDGEGYEGRRRDRYGMVYDEEELRRRHERERKYDSERRERSRSRSPQRDRRDVDRSEGRRGDRRVHDDSEMDRDRNRYDDRRQERGGRGGRGHDEYRRR